MDEVKEIKLIDPEQRQKIVDDIFNIIDKEDDLSLIEVCGILEHVKLCYHNQFMNDEDDLE